ncbi:MAG: hypothetical protein AMXMBFR7_49680 [Planctomycetota bacterium]
MLRICRIAFVCLLLAAHWVIRAEDLLELLDDPAPKPAKDGASKTPAKNQPKQSGLLFRWVALDRPDENLNDRTFWRVGGTGFVGAAVPPVRLKVDAEAVIEPYEQERHPDIGGVYRVYPVEGRTLVTNGDHLLQPFAIPFKMAGGQLASEHPALIASKSGLSIKCAQIRLEAVNASGLPVPFDIRLSCNGESILRETTPYCPLLAWLPVGVAYESTLGRLVLKADGTLDASASKLAEHVVQIDGGLQLRLPPGKPLVSPFASSASITPKPRKRDPKPGQPARLRLKNAPYGIPELRVYLPLRVPAGRSAGIAFVRAEVEKATAAPFKAERFELDPSQNDPPDRTPARVLADPSEEQAAEAADLLGVPPADLAWLRLPIPANQVGALSFRINLTGLGQQALTFPVLEWNAGPGPVLIPHRMRTVYTREESAPVHILTPPGSPAGSGRLYYRGRQPDAPVLELGALECPAASAEAYASRTVTIPMRELPLGIGDLWFEFAGQSGGKIPLEIVPFEIRSTFLTQYQGSCGGAPPFDEDGLSILHAGGLDSVATCGHNSSVDRQMPELSLALAQALTNAGADVPLEAVVGITPNDLLLQSLLRHRMRLADLTVARGPAFYNEGLSYHHSYQPSVDRMVRNLQLAAQQTGEYPSLWGFNYSWFPTWWGYVEGGVPCDGHVQARNEALTQKLKKAGLAPVAREEHKWYTEKKLTKDPAERAKVLELQKRLMDWNAAQYQGSFADHNELYNAAVHAVKPDLACMLFENGGHDAGKVTEALFHDMAASAYEIYSDYPEWPMSAAWVTEWAHGLRPGQPVWATTDWGTSSEGTMKSLFHAFGRGMDGGGVVMPGTLGRRELERRGKGLRFVSQYGAIATHAHPERRIALLVPLPERRLGGQSAFYYNHAVYYYLTRLGLPPIVLTEESFLQNGAPEGVQALLCVQCTQPVSAALQSRLAQWVQAGGKLAQVGAVGDEMPGAVSVNAPLKNLMQLGGFQMASSAKMWEEFETWRRPLGDLLAQWKLAPVARVDPDLALAVPLQAGAVRYAVVVADVKGEHSREFRTREALPVSIEGTGWKIRDLVKQADVPGVEQDGRTEIKVDLVTEPCTVLAWYAAPPAAVKLETGGALRLGAGLNLRASVADGAGQDLGPLPVRYTLTAPGGAVYLDLFRAAGQAADVHLPALAPAGLWTLRAQELLNGWTAMAELEVAAHEAKNLVLDPAGPAHVVDPRQLRAFLAKPGEKSVVLEPGQEHLEPAAVKLIERLNAAGIAARLWKIGPEHFDTLPVRWFPWAEEAANRAAVSEGRAIGIRENLSPYIDAKNRVHVPIMGGYAEAPPAYMLARDVILFAGGRLENSLGAVTAWRMTPHVPAAGHARLVVCFSPFTANQDALSVQARDAAGIAAAAEALAEHAKPAPPPAAAAPVAWTARPAAPATAPVPTPFVGYAPVRRLVSLHAQPDGRLAAVLNGQRDTLAFVGPDGRLEGTCAPGEIRFDYASFDAQGRIWGQRVEVLERHPSWHFPTREAYSLVGIVAAGTVAAEQVVYDQGSGFEKVPPDFRSAFRIAPDGQTAFAAYRGGLSWGPIGRRDWNRFDDLAQAWHRDSIRQPRMPVGLTLTPDGRHALFSLDVRPDGWGNMNQPPEHPCMSETRLLELATGKTAWTLTSREVRNAMKYVVHRGFGAVSNGADWTAMCDYAGVFRLIDAAGKPVLEHPVTRELPDRYGVGPQGGLGCWMDARGALAAGLFRHVLVLAVPGADAQALSIPVDEASAGALALDGSLFCVALLDGTVRAIRPDGQTAWTFAAGGIAPKLAATEKGFWVGTSAGELILLDLAGKEVCRVDAAAAADREAHPVKPAAQVDSIPYRYREPRTLELAQNALGARKLAEWKPDGAGREAFGRTFHAAPPSFELAAGATKECFLHLVYIRAAGNKSARVTVQGAGAPITFDLDLPTPEYRVVDIPLRGENAKVKVVSDGPFEVAEATLWDLPWPTPNLAYVKPAGSEPADVGVPGQKPKPAGDNAFDEMATEVGAPEAVGGKGKMKDCRIVVPNPDIDKVKGQTLPPAVDPYKMVNGKRFEKLEPWADDPYVGQWFEIDLTRPTEVGLLAAYDRETKLSRVAQQLCAYEALGDGHRVLDAASFSDQFWRLYEIDARKKVQRVGLSIWGPSAVGLSEIELYGLKK